MRTCLAVVIYALVVCASEARDKEPHSKLAAKWIPFEELSLTNQVLVSAVTDHYTLSREYESKRFDAKAVHFAFLLDHMLTTSIIAHHLKLIEYRVKVDDEGRTWADDGKGSKGSLQQVLAIEGKRVFYVVGSRKGLLEARGRGVSIVEFNAPESNVVEYTAAAFVKVDNSVLAVLTQLFRVFLTETVDDNFAHVLRHPILISKMALEKPAELRKLIQAMPPEDRELVAPFEKLISD